MINSVLFFENFRKFDWYSCKKTGCGFWICKKFDTVKEADMDCDLFFQRETTLLPISTLVPNFNFLRTAILRHQLMRHSVSSVYIKIKG